VGEAKRFGIIRRLMRHRQGASGAFVLILLVLVALLGSYITPYDPNEPHLLDQLAPPSSTYWFGTDELGRDIFSRVIVAARPAVASGLLAVVFAALVGVSSGLVTGFFGGWVDAVIMRIWDTLLAFPTIFLAIGIVAILGPGWINAVIAISVVNMPVFSRLVRAATLSAKGQDYALAARAIGTSNVRLMFRHLLPNTIMPAIVQMAIAAPFAIVVEATLSFLGLGSQPPDASWGNMLSDAQAYLRRSFTFAIFPGLAITIVVIAMNFFADGVQDVLDPRRIRAGRTK
jgi:peptide/nickel transport system permease protein